MKKTTILVVEDESAIRDMIRFALPSSEFIMLEAENVSEAVRQLTERTPNLIILDWMLPGKSGIDFIKWLKQKPLVSEIPVIMLTARAEEENKIKGLEIGADDYITKPFSPGELIARIKTILRRGSLITPTGIIHVKALSLDVNTHQVMIGDAVLALTSVEYRLLHFFLTHQNRVYTRDQLITHIWGNSTYIDERTVDVQVRRLRNCLKPYSYHVCIETVRGAGYRFSGEAL